MSRPGTSNPRWREKPCTQCGAVDWMFGRRHLCSSCRKFRVISEETKTKIAAQRMVQDAIRKGLLTRQTCEACARQGKVQNGPSHGHHEDYSKPLDVVWLCALHHRWTHLDGLAYVLGERSAA